MGKDSVAGDQAPLESQEPLGNVGGHTVGPDYPGVTGTPAEGTRDMDRVAEEGLDDEGDEDPDDE